MREPIYVAMGSARLAHYFANGCILPSAFIENKPADLQDQAAGAIILSSSRWLPGANCSLEIVLTASERAKMQTSSTAAGLFLHHGFIPISRIKRIFFRDSGQMKNTIWNINNGVGFVPDWMVEVDTSSPILAGSIALDGFEPANMGGGEELRKRIKYFNHLLGGISLMNVGARENAQYADHYFSFVSLLNKRIEEDAKLAHHQKGLPFSREYAGLVSRDDLRWELARKYIYSRDSVEFGEVEQEAKRLRVKIPPIRSGLVELRFPWDNRELYLIAILAMYGDSKPKTTQDLVSDIDSGKIPALLREEAALCLGLHLGYSKLRNRYMAGRKDRNVKFKLDSRLDYYIIESVYQLAMSNHGAAEFDYLDAWIPKGASSYRTSNTFSILGLDLQVFWSMPLFSKEYNSALLQGIRGESFARIVHAKLKSTLPAYFQIDGEQLDKEFTLAFTNEAQRIVGDLLGKVMHDFEADQKAIVEQHAAEIESLKQKLAELEAKTREARPSVEKNPKPVPYPTSSPAGRNPVREPGQQYGEMNRQQLEKMTREALKDMAKDLGLTAKSSSTKRELIHLIQTQKPML